MKSTSRGGWISRWSIVPACLIGLVGIGALVQTSTLAREESVETREGGRAARTSSATADRKLLEGKLDEILDHQQQILKRLDQVMEELRVVKIRATMR